jgi:hypothetical protein
MEAVIIPWFACFAGGLHVGPICASMVGMKRIIALSFLLAMLAALVVWAQTKAPATVYAQYEMRSVFPRETSPAMYEQVSQQELQTLASQGWELVSVTPFVVRNEERGPALNNKPAVTQSYPAYFFKRVKLLKTESVSLIPAHAP